MATWNSDNIILTKLGEQVLSKVQSGVGKLTVSRIVSGAGHVSPSQLYNQTQVTDIKQELTIAKCTTTESQSTISANLTNTGLGEAYDLYQIGIYVTHPDFTDEVLYLIAQCDSPDHIPLPGDSPVTLSYDLVMAHSGTKEVIINVSEAGYVDITTLTKFAEEINTALNGKANSTDLDEHKNDNTMHVTAEEKAAWNGKAELSDIPTTLPADGGNADTTNNHTVESDVPANAIFTDTKVTAVGNHYTPSGGSTTSASGGTLTDITNSSAGVQVVTGVTKDAAGHVTGVTSVALKSTNTNTTYSNFVKSGSGAKAGLVPAPSTTAGTTKYLREDGSWQVPPNTTYSNMTAATANAAGKAGLVPAPAAGKQTSFLRGDGTWVVPTNTTYGNASTSTAGLVSTGAQTLAGNKTFNGQVIPAGASDVTIAQARKIYAGTSDMTAGTTALETGAIYLVYE